MDNNAEIIGIFFQDTIVEDAEGIDFPVSVQMEGCGSQGGPWTLATFPRENVPCPCGDPSHWLVQYRKSL